MTRHRSDRRSLVVDTLLLFAAALALRLARLDHLSLWIDETFSVRWSGLATGFILGTGRPLEPTPPGYYLVLHAWERLAGTSAAAARLPSVAFSAVTVLPVYGIGRTLMGRAGGRLAAALFVVDPMSIYLAQEARAYALLGLIDAVMLGALVAAERRTSSAAERRMPDAAERRMPDAAERGLPSARERRNGSAGDAATFAARRASDAPPVAALLVLALASGAAVFTHYTAILLVAACYGAGGRRLLATGAWRTRAVRPWIGSAALAALLVALPLRDAAHLAGSNNINWIPPLGFGSVRNFLEEVVTYPSFEHRPIEHVIFVLIGLVVLSGLARRVPTGALLDASVVVPALFVAFGSLLSLHAPIMLARIGIGLVPSLVLLLAHAILALPRPWLRRGGAAIAFAAFGVATLCYFTWHTQQDWRRAARIAATDPRCDGPVMTWGPYDIDMLQYAPGLARRPLIAVMPPMFDGTATGRLNDVAADTTRLPPAGLASYLDGHDHAVLVTMAMFLRDEAPFLPSDGHPALLAPLPGGLEIRCQ